MNSAIQNKLAVETLIEKVKAHCMCLRFTESKAAGYYLIYIPSGYQVDGVRAHYSNAVGCGKAVALERALVKMEQLWKDSLAPFSCVK